MSGPLLGHGRRKTVLIGNVIILLSYALQLQINVYALAVGKGLQGTGAGMILSAAAIMIPETVPLKLGGHFGSLINLGIVLGTSLYMFLNLLVPPLDDPAALSTTQIWRYLFFLPSITACVIIFMFVAVLRQDTIVFDLANENEEDARTLIKRIYQPTTDDVHEVILKEYIEA